MNFSLPPESRINRVSLSYDLKTVIIQDKQKQIIVPFEEFHSRFDQLDQSAKEKLRFYIAGEDLSKSKLKGSFNKIFRSIAKIFHFPITSDLLNRALIEWVESAPNSEIASRIIASRKIKKAIIDRSTILDLSKLGLSTLPDIISNLSIERLVANENKFDTKPPHFPNQLADQEKYFRLSINSHTCFDDSISIECATTHLFNSIEFKAKKEAYKSKVMNQKSLATAHPGLKEDRDFIVLYLEKYPDELYLITDTLWNDAQFIQSILKLHSIAATLVRNPKFLSKLIDKSFEFGYLDSKEQDTPDLLNLIFNQYDHIFEQMGLVHLKKLIPYLPINFFMHPVYVQNLVSIPNYENLLSEEQKNNLLIQKSLLSADANYFDQLSKLEKSTMLDVRTFHQLQINQFDEPDFLKKLIKTPNYQRFLPSFILNSREKLTQLFKLDVSLYAFLPLDLKLDSESIFFCLSHIESSDLSVKELCNLIPNAFWKDDQKAIKFFNALLKTQIKPQFKTIFADQIYFIITKSGGFSSKIIRFLEFYKNMIHRDFTIQNYQNNLPEGILLSDLIHYSRKTLQYPLLKIGMAWLPNESSEIDKIYSKYKDLNGSKEEMSKLISKFGLKTVLNWMTPETYHEIPIELIPTDHASIKELLTDFPYFIMHLDRNLREKFQTYAVHEFVRIFKTKSLKEIIGITAYKTIDQKMEIEKSIPIFYENVLFHNYSALIQHMNNIAQFSGIAGKFDEYNLEGSYINYMLFETEAMIDQVPNLSISESFELKKAFYCATRYDYSSTQLDQESQLLIIPVGFSYKDPKSDSFGGHSASLIMKNGQLVICNRGNRPKDKKTLEFFNIDRKLMTKDIIKYLFWNTYCLNYPNTHSLFFVNYYLYQIIPEILNGTKTNVDESYQLKSQTIGNCTKAAAVGAFKAALYLINIEKGYSQEKAVEDAKFRGGVLSSELRTEMERRVEKFINFQSDENKRKQMESILSLSKAKTKEKKAKLKSPETTLSRSAINFSNSLLKVTFDIFKDSISLKI